MEIQSWRIWLSSFARSEANKECRIGLKRPEPLRLLPSAPLDLNQI